MVKIDKTDDKIKKAVARAVDMEKGKTVLVEVDEKTFFRVDHRCMAKDTDKCSGCGIRFNCYSSQYLVIPYKKLYPNGWNVDYTISELAEEYIKCHQKVLDKS